MVVLTSCISKNQNPDACSTGAILLTGRATGGKKIEVNVRPASGTVDTIVFYYLKQNSHVLLGRKNETENGKKKKLKKKPEMLTKR